MVVERFLSWLQLAPAPERVLAARSMAAAYLKAGLEGEEGEIADAVITALVDDPSPDVRLALAVALGDHAAAPRHVVMSLAADSVEISAAVLSRSPVFVDGELVDMVAEGCLEQQVAIACRPKVPPSVAAALAEVAGLEACIGLLSNAGAEILPVMLHRVAERFGEEAEIRRLLFAHEAIAPRTRILLIEKLGKVVAGAVGDNAFLNAGRLECVARDNCDRATIAYAARAGEADLPEIVAAVIASGRMNVAFLLRSICMGNISLFAASMAALAGIPLSRVETVLADDRRTVFRALYRKAGLPDFALEVFSGAIETWRGLLASGEADDADRLPFLVTRQLLAVYSGQLAPGSRADPQLDTLLVLLRKLAAETARNHARREIGRLAAESSDEPVLALAPPQVRSDSEREDQPEETATPKENEVMELPEDVIAEFALHFAEEIADLEEELATGTRAGLSDDMDAFARDDDLEVILSEEDLVAAIDFDDLDRLEMPVGAANDDRRAPAVRAAHADMPKTGRDEPVSVLVGATRAHLRRGMAA